MTIKTPQFNIPQVDANDSRALFSAIYDETHHFFKHFILWGLEQFEIGRLDGQHDIEFLAQYKLETAAFGYLKADNEAVFEMMTEVNEKSGKMFGDAIFGSALRELLSQGAIAHDSETGGVATLVPVN
jgi:hypothetical protein